MHGPVAGVPPLLQPVAHALLQAKEEVVIMMKDFPAELLWIKVAGMASVAFHLQHMTGVLDRLFTYAGNGQLTTEQLVYLGNEGKVEYAITPELLVAAFNMAVQQAIKQLKMIDENILTEFRGVGRKKLPSTVIGLLVHAAEHTMRHTGQLLVTINVLKAGL